MDETTTPRRRLISAKTGVFLLVLVAIAGAGSGYYYYTEASKAKDPQKAAQDEAKKLVATVGRLMVLPSDELPIVATVADPEKLKDQAFFAKAKKGDKVLIFNNAHKAILYDPVGDKIVDVAPLSIGSQASPTPTK